MEKLCGDLYDIFTTVNNIYFILFHFIMNKQITKNAWLKRLRKYIKHKRSATKEKILQKKNTKKNTYMSHRHIDYFWTSQSSFSVIYLSAAEMC